jgi:tight adherence protein C
MDLIFSPLGAATLVALAFFVLLLALRPGQRSRAVEERMGSLVARESALIARGPAAVGQVEGSLFQRVLLPAVRGVVQALGRLTPGVNAAEIQRQLTVAGRPANLGPADFLGLRILLAVLGLVLGYLYGRTMAGNPHLALIAPLAAAALGYMLPNYWLKSHIRKRQDIIQRALPDALDMLTICVEAGLAFESALQRVSDQWAGPLSDEFGRVVAEMRLGVPRPQALRRLAERCDVLDVSSFVAVLVQADTMGTSIAQVLHSQADQMRVLRRQRAEEKANKAPIKVLVAMLLFIFPALFVVILGPALPKITETFASMSGR